MAKSFLILLVFVFSSLFANSQERTLDDYITTGLKNSPLLKDYNNQRNAGQIDSLLVLCGYQPQVAVTSQAMYAPAGKHLGYNEAITNGGNYAALIGVKQSLFNTKIKSAQLQGIELLKQSLEVNKLITGNDLKKAITTQYLAAFADLSQEKFLKSTVEALGSQQKLVKTLVESGIYQQTDLMNLAVAMEAQSISQQQAFILYKNDLALLNLLCGKVDTAYTELSKPEIRLSARPAFNMLPVMLQSRIDSLKNSNSRKLIDMNYRPKLEAFADAGFMAIKPADIPNNFGTSFGLNFSIPIYDGKQRYQEYKKIEIAEKSRVLYRDYFLSQYQQQYNQLMQQLQLLDDLSARIHRQLAQQQELIELYKAEMEKGLVRFTDYLAVVNNYASTQNNLVLAEMNRMQLINQLNYLK